MTLPIKTPFFLFFLFIVQFISAQNIKSDSLQLYFTSIDQLVSETKQIHKDEEIKSLIIKKDASYGIEKIDLLHQLYRYYIYQNLETANNYNREALSLSQELKYFKGIHKSSHNYAYYLFIKGDFNTSMNSMRISISKINHRSYPEIYGDLHNLKADIHTEKGEYDKALDTGLQLLDIAERSNNKYLLMHAHAALSHYYLRLEKYQQALDHCLKGLDFILELKLTHLLFQKVDEIARMSAKLGDSKQALAAYDYFSKLEEKLYSPGSYIKSSVYMNIADIYMNTGEYDKAQNNLTEAMALNTKNNYRFRIPRALILQAELYLKQKDTLNAILSYERSIDAAENINAFDVIKPNSLILTELYASTNNQAKVYEYKTLYGVIKDSLFNNEKEQRIIILETRRKIKEARNKQQELELEFLIQKAKYKTIIFSFSICVILGIFVVFSYVKIKEKNKLLYRKTIENLESQLKAEGKNYIKNNKSVTKKENIPVKMNDNVKNIILKKLKKLENEKFFIDPNCNLHHLSEKLKTNSKYLSNVINIEKGSNFNNYINDLRINYLLTKLIQDEEFRNSKLSYISTSIGYNNLNTFNTAFKKRQGILPSFFIKQLNEESSNI